MDYIHIFLPGRKKHTLVLLHGTGGTEQDLISLAKIIDKEASILAIRGNVLENGMSRFFKRFSEGVFDIEDLKIRTKELGDFISSASKKYSFDSPVIVGYSNGANIGASLILLMPQVARTAILFRAMLPLVPEKLPDLSSTDLFISCGTLDQVIPKQGTLDLLNLLKEARANVTMNWEESNHALTRVEVEKASNWLALLH
ncbi:MAG: alpha/beta hydrolase [Nitrososphaerales archaeon]